MSSPPSSASVAPLDIPSLAKAIVRECPSSWHSYSGFGDDCPPLNTFRTLTIAPGAADATFVDLLADPDERTRLLGAWGLASWGGRYKTDTALATRVVDAAGRGAGESVALLGYAMASIDLVATGLVGRVNEMLLHGHLPDALRLGALTSFVPENRACDECFIAARELAERAGRSDQRIAVIESFSAVAARRGPEVCATWMKLLGDADDIVAAATAARVSGGATSVTVSLTGWKHTFSHPDAADACWDRTDALLAIIERRIDTGFAAEDGWVTALEGVLRDGSRATDQQKERATAAARRLLQNADNGPGARVAALRLVATRDPDAKAFLARFTKDTSPQVRAAVEDARVGR